MEIKPFGKKSRDFIRRRPEQDKRYTIMVGSVRSSKTFTLGAKLLIQLNRYKVDGKRVITGTTKQSLYRNVLLDLFDIVGKRGYSYNQSTGELWLDGVQWFCMGAKDEASYKQILGMTVGMYVGDEIVEYPKSFLSQVFLRMSPAGARFYGTTNPGNPYCYLKKEVIDNPAFAKDLEVMHFTLRNNPNILPEVKEAIIASQVGVYKLRYIDGLWVVAEGSIYRDSWNEVENTFEQEPATLRNAGGYVDNWYAIDPGVDHPQATIEFFDDGDTIWATREDVWDSRMEMKQLTDGQYADRLEKFMGGRGKQVILPPEAASYATELTLRGFWVTDADNAVSEGIHTVSTLLSRRKLRISKTGCPRLVSRLPNYSWDGKAALRGIEQPLKVEDDECDALRYGVHGKILPWRVSGQS